MYELHHAELVLHGDIPCKKYRYKTALIADVQQILIRNTLSVRGKRVYLITIEYHENEDSAIFIDDNNDNINSYLINNTMTPTMCKVFLQEYESYQAAFEVALAMKEVNPLCYDQKEPPIGRLDVLPINVN